MRYQPAEQLPIEEIEQYSPMDQAEDFLTITETNVIAWRNKIPGKNRD